MSGRTNRDWRNPATASGRAEEASTARRDPERQPHPVRGHSAPRRSSSGTGNASVASSVASSVGSSEGAAEKIPRVQSPQFPSNMSYVSEAQRSDIATVGEGSVMEEVELEGFHSADDAGHFHLPMARLALFAGTATEAPERGTFFPGIIPQAATNRSGQATVAIASLNSLLKPEQEETLDSGSSAEQEQKVVAKTTIGEGREDDETNHHHNADSSPTETNSTGSRSDDEHCTVDEKKPSSSASAPPQQQFDGRATLPVSASLVPNDFRPVLGYDHRQSDQPQVSRHPYGKTDPYSQEARSFPTPTRSRSRSRSPDVNMKRRDAP